MTEADNHAHENPVRKPATVKNSTVLGVLCLVIIPWTLLALPGYFGGSHYIHENNVKSESIVRNFGWPLTHKTETTVEVLGVKRGGQFRADDPLPKAKFDKLMETYVAHHDENDASMLNLVPRAAEGQAFTLLWTQKDSYPIELRKYIQDNVIESSTRQVWKTPMLIANIVLAVLTCLFVGYLFEKASK